MSRRPQLIAPALRFLRRADWPLLPLAAAIAACGLLVQWSVSGPEAFPSAHVVRLAVAAAAGAAAAMLSPRRWRALAGPFYVACLLLLLYVLLFGDVTNGARRWIDLGGSFKLQPSEFAKLALIVLLARRFADRPRPAGLRDLLAPAALALLPAALVLPEPDLGTALTFAPTFLALAYLAGTPRRTLLLLLLAPAALAPLAALGLQDYQKERISIWWRQDHLSAEEKAGAGYHLWHSKLAVGSGGLSGQGWAQGPENRLDRLPERHNDFIFPVVAEEFGFLGASAFLALYFTLAAAALWAAARYRDPFTRFVIAGVGVHFAVHLVINVGVTLGLWPTTGLPLPMISWGGSSLMVSGMAIGLALSVSAGRDPVLSGRAYQD